jgi:hypothetical protein
MILYSLPDTPAQDNYPEMLGHICIINAPAIFRVLWSVVKNMIDTRTQNKIEVRAGVCVARACVGGCVTRACGDTGVL